MRAEVFIEEVRVRRRCDARTTCGRGASWHDCAAHKWAVLSTRCRAGRWWTPPSTRIPCLRRRQRRRHIDENKILNLKIATKMEIEICTRIFMTLVIFTRRRTSCSMRSYLHIEINNFLKKNKKKRKFDFFKKTKQFKSIYYHPNKQWNLVHISQHPSHFKTKHLSHSNEQNTIQYF